MAPSNQAPLREADDDELVAKVLAGNNPAAESLVRRHAGWMLSLARHYTQDQAIAEDCVQEAFANAFSRLATFEHRSSLRTWLHRIVVNQALMKLRSGRARKENELEELQPEFDTNACRIEEPWRRILTPEEIVGNSRLRTLVLEKIYELPETFRNVLIFRDIEEMTTSEAAVALGLSEANVKVRLHRARAALKRLLEPVLRGEVE